MLTADRDIYATRSPSSSASKLEARSLRLPQVRSKRLVSLAGEETLLMARRRGPVDSGCGAGAFWATAARLLPPSLSSACWFRLAWSRHRRWEARRGVERAR